MNALVGIAGLAVVLTVLWEAFEAVVLPRRPTRKFRLTRVFYRSTWIPWAWFSRRIRPTRRRETVLAYFGPLSLLVLFAVWAVGLILAFGLLQWATGSAFHLASGGRGFLTDLYMSGTTFFTLGLGDVVPESTLARFLTVAEAGLGFGFLALVIGYLPVMYQAFSRREVNISLLDARAGSPPTAGELLRRHAYPHGLDALHDLLGDWERWSAELLESHLSYPVLAYFRSQHNNQSWLGSLTAILDTSALVLAGIEGTCARQAELTFAMARHAAVDLAQVFGSAPRATSHDRLPPSELEQLRRDLAEAGLTLHTGAAADARLAELRRLYEPYVHSLSMFLLQPLPGWMNPSRRRDNWQTSAWEKPAEAAAPGLHPVAEEDHF